MNREGAREFLESQGVQFPPGASAHFLPESSRLIVRNTEDNLELVDALVEQANVSGPKQVEIEAKFVEINQNNLKELGFDWLLGNFGVGGNKIRFGRRHIGNWRDSKSGKFSQSDYRSGNRSNQSVSRDLGKSKRKSGDQWKRYRFAARGDRRRAGACSRNIWPCWA